jgi:hypothetical protein
MKYLVTISLLNLCQLTSDYKSKIIKKQHFEIEKLYRVNKYLQDLSYGNKSFLTTNTKKRTKPDQE